MSIGKRVFFAAYGCILLLGGLLFLSAVGYGASFLRDLALSTHAPLIVFTLGGMLVVGGFGLALLAMGWLMFVDGARGVEP